MAKTNNKNKKDEMKKVNPELENEIAVDDVDEDDPFADLERMQENKKSKKNSKSKKSSSTVKNAKKEEPPKDYIFEKNTPVVANYQVVHTFKKGEKIDGRKIIESIRNILKNKGIQEAEDTQNYELRQGLVSVPQDGKIIKVPGYEFVIVERHSKG